MKQQRVINNVIFREKINNNNIYYDNQNRAYKKKVIDLCFVIAYYN